MKIETNEHNKDRQVRKKEKEWKMGRNTDKM